MVDIGCVDRIGILSVLEIGCFKDIADGAHQMAADGDEITLLS